MVRLKIPAIYRLDVGSSKWGWHRMSELTQAINGLIYFSQLNRMTSEQIIRRFAYIQGSSIWWSDGCDLEPISPIQLVLKDPKKCFIPAGWGMAIIKEIEKIIDSR